VSIGERRPAAAAALERLDRQMGVATWPEAATTNSSRSRPRATRWPKVQIPW